MKITFRMDDITPDMNWDNFNRVTSLLEEREIFPLLGIVPENQDTMLSLEPARDDFADCMLSLQKKGYVLAMHGATHVYETKKSGLFPLNQFSEFAGVELEKQREKLKKAKSQLEDMGIHTNIFMAPGHTFDQNTVKVLRELGFTHITDGFGKAPYRRDNLVYFPIAFKKDKAFTEAEGMTTIVLHVNQWKEEDFRDFEKLLEEKAEFFCKYSAWFEQVVTEQNASACMREYLQATIKRILVKILDRMRL